MKLFKYICIAFLLSFFILVFPCILAEIAARYGYIENKVAVVEFVSVFNLLLSGFVLIFYRMDED